MSEKSGLRAIGYVEKCGHNFPPMECPYERCGYREAMARVAELEAVLNKIAAWPPSYPANANIQRIRECAGAVMEGK